MTVMVYTHPIAKQMEDMSLFLTPPVKDKKHGFNTVHRFISQGCYSSVQFHIPGSQIQYIDHFCIELYVKLKIGKEDGEEFDGLHIDKILHTM